MCEDEDEEPDENYSDGYRDTHVLEKEDDEKDADVGLPLGWEGVEIVS